MDKVFACPVCGLKNIPVDKVSCPQCDADLTCFRLLDSLPESTFQEKQITTSRLPIALVATLLIAIIVFLTGIAVSQFRWIKRLEVQVQDNGADVIKSLNRIDVALNHIEHTLFPEKIDHQAEAHNITNNSAEDRGKGTKAFMMTSGNTSSYAKGKSQAAETNTSHTDNSEKPEDDFFIYQAKDTDTLWNISERYYGNGIYYPVLLEHNPGLGIYAIGEGIEMKVLTDKTRVKEIYKEITML